MYLLYSASLKSRTNSIKSKLSNSIKNSCGALFFTISSFQLIVIFPSFFFHTFQKLQYFRFYLIDSRFFTHTVHCNIYVSTHVLSVTDF
jgi:hypothetical protein